ncbi:MAG: hypothetical protein HQL95_08885, partial [Magnetococcales bacterium]|nr:hypothetical protein [Magnetococcales bacterium]
MNTLITVMGMQEIQEKEHTFLLEYRRTGNASEAYRTAFGDEGLSKQAIYGKATRLLKRLGTQEVNVPVNGTLHLPPSVNGLGNAEGHLLGAVNGPVNGLVNAEAHLPGTVNGPVNGLVNAEAHLPGAVNGP